MKPDGAALLWGPLVEGRLIKRYKRFLADVELIDGKIITAHTPNTGRMTGCSEPGRRVFMSLHQTPGRKYPHSLEMIEMPHTLVGINTQVPNKLVAHSLRCGQILSLPQGAQVQQEVCYGQSRLDLFVKNSAGEKDIFIEVKNCTLAENGLAYFPDAVTERGRKHLLELEQLVKDGYRAIIFILVQRADASCFCPADHIDPAWGQALRSALDGGVELLAYQALLDFKSISLGPQLTVKL